MDETVPERWFGSGAMDQVGNIIALARGLAVKKGVLFTVEQRFLNRVPTAPFIPCYTVLTSRWLPPTNQSLNGLRSS